MKILPTAFFLLLSTAATAQNLSVVTTDSSRIETRLYPGGREVKEILTAKDLVYYRFYRNDQTVATTTGTRTKAGRPTGITRDYNDRNQLLYTVDHDRGTWRVADKQLYPFYGIQDHMRAKADSTIAAIYGRQFLLTSTVWNVQGSAIYNAKESGNWTDSFVAKPTKFLFRYDVKLSPRRVYPELIEFELDANGNFIPNEFERIFGFEKRPQVPTPKFTLAYRSTIEMTRKKSGARNQPLSGFLKWESFKKPALYNGHFRFYVPIKTGTLTDLHPKGRSSVTDRFDVYVFNPWTGAFIEKKKMKAVRSWEERSGNSSGLVPDN
ncbi:hypothetical protein [Hymenobacter coccineus]|uniref:Uncharacterized protein n=1 Tax=Hymenobacter coccineus TaxID=1908235 RepID=A0A1G1TLI1_9BACT|nr:hypothetical protein [Hymenobacter coccineus]OGX91705.1 hypothetical protein BEN49_18805 [Hymenobacter coccineus]